MMVRKLPHLTSTNPMAGCCIPKFGLEIEVSELS